MNIFDYEYKGIYISRLIIFLSSLFIIEMVYAISRNENILEYWLATIMLLGSILLCGKIGELWQELKDY